MRLSSGLNLDNIWLEKLQFSIWCTIKGHPDSKWCRYWIAWDQLHNYTSFELIQSIASRHHMILWQKEHTFQRIKTFNWIDWFNRISYLSFHYSYLCQFAWAQYLSTNVLQSRIFQMKKTSNVIPFRWVGQEFLITLRLNQCNR